MAESFNMSRFFRMFSTTETSKLCNRCHRMVVMCSCSATDQAVISSVASVFEDSSVFDVSFLDIENTEAYDLDVAAPMCEKSHQHDDYIDVDDFNIEHLPDELRHQSTYEWLRNCTPLVVRLLRNVAATGRACLIAEENGRTIVCDNVHCPYLNVLDRGHDLHGGIGIITNSHVVRNDDEASMTRIEFFYDSDETRSANVVKEFGSTLRTTNSKMDYTLFSCFVHNKELISFIEKLDKSRNKSWMVIPPEIRIAAKNFAIVISHPHGASKKISIGKVVDRKIHVKNDTQKENGRILRNIYDLCEASPHGLIRFEAYWRQIKDIDLPFTVTWYTAPTCKGSSGAPVYMGNTVTEYGEEINQAHTHRGVDSAKGFNNCFT